MVSLSSTAVASLTRAMSLLRGELSCGDGGRRATGMGDPEPWGWGTLSRGDGECRATGTGDPEPWGWGTPSLGDGGA